MHLVSPRGKMQSRLLKASAKKMKRITNTFETDAALQNIVLDTISDYKLERARKNGRGHVFGKAGTC